MQKNGPPCNRIALFREEHHFAGAINPTEQMQMGLEGPCILCLARGISFGRDEGGARGIDGRRNKELLSEGLKTLPHSIWVHAFVLLPRFALHFWRH